MAELMTVATLAWVMLATILYTFDVSTGPFKWDGHQLFGILPVLPPWAVWWVVQGFKSEDRSRKER